jgi:hypothetical protein
VAPKTIALTFGGYWRDVNSAGIPNESGIYLVYTCTYNRRAETVDLHRLLYVGESDRVRNRIQGHEKRSKWQAYLLPGQELCYSFAPIASPDRQRAEAALIYHHQPPVNDDYRDSFPFDETTVSSSGRCAFIDALFTVRRTVLAGWR